MLYQCRSLYTVLCEQVTLQSLNLLEPSGDSFTFTFTYCVVYL
jgi:hypothetical protein